MMLRFVLFILVNGIFYAQSGYIRGTVLSELSEPLPGANVSIKETGTGAMTDMEGKFSIDGLYPGSYTLNISFIGYKRISKTYVITSDEDGQNFLEKVPGFVFHLRFLNYLFQILQLHLLIYPKIFFLFHY